MPPIENTPENTTETATVEAAKPETGADTTATVPTPPQTDTTPVEATDTVDEVAKWKAMSRKNEDQAKANLKQLQAYEAELAQVKAENTRLAIKGKYPQINDDVLSLCSETDPEKIEAWAERYATLNPVKTETKPAPVPADPLVRKTGRLAENPEGAFNPKPKSGDAYQRSQNRQKSRSRRYKQSK